MFITRSTLCFYTIETVQNNVYKYALKQCRFLHVSICSNISFQIGDSC